MIKKAPVKKPLGSALKVAKSGSLSVLRMSRNVTKSDSKKKPPVPPKPSIPLTILTAETYEEDLRRAEEGVEEGDLEPSDTEDNGSVSFGAGTVPERPSRTGPTRASATAVRGAVRESRLMSVAKSFICADTSAFKKQMQKEEELEELYQQTRQLPLPAPPPSAVPVIAVTTDRGSVRVQDKNLLAEDTKRGSKRKSKAKRPPVPNKPLPVLPENALAALKEAEEDARQNVARRTRTKRAATVSTSMKTAAVQAKIASVFAEILESEKAYLHQLNLIVELYLMPIREKKLLNKFEIVSLFSNVESILSLGMNLLKEFSTTTADKKIALWIDQAKMRVDVNPGDMGDIFLHFSDAMLVKYTTYCSNLPNIADRIAQFSIDSDAFHQLLSTAATDPRIQGKTLKELLFLPLERLKEYCVLFDALQSVTSKESSVHELELTVWGDGSKGFQLIESETSPHWSAISCGGFHMAALTKTGKVATWGRGKFGQLGLGEDALYCTTPTFVSGDLGEQRIEKIYAGPITSAAITDVGELWLWGLIPSIGPTFVPTKAPFEELDGRKVLDVALTPSVLVLLLEASDNGGTEVWTMGSCKVGELGHGEASAKQRTPRRVVALDNKRVASVRAGSDHVAALTSEGELYLWGNNEANCLGVGHPNLTDSTVPCLVPSLKGIRMVEVTCGHNLTIARTEDDILYGWGSTKVGGLGHGQNPPPVITEAQPIPALSSTKFSSVHCGGRHTCAVSYKGEIFVWGEGIGYKTGQANEKDLLEPTKCSFLADYKIAALACGMVGNAAMHFAPSEYVRVHNGFTALEDMLSAVETQVDEVKNVTQLIGLEATIENAEEYHIRDTTRAFVLDGILEREGLPCYVVVLSDVVLLCQVITLPQPPQIDGLFSITHQVDLGNCITSDFTEEDRLNHIEIGEIGEELHLLRCSGVEEKHKWFTTINAAINNYFGGVEAGLSVSMPKSEAMPPPPSALPPPPAALPPAPLSPSPRRPQASSGGPRQSPRPGERERKAPPTQQTQKTRSPAGEEGQPPVIAVSPAVSSATRNDAVKSPARPPVAPRASRLQASDTEPPPVAPRQQRGASVDDRSPTPEKTAPPVAPRRPSVADEQRAPSPSGGRPMGPLGGPVPSPSGPPAGLGAASGASPPASPPAASGNASAAGGGGALGGGLGGSSKSSKKMNFTKSVSKKMMKGGSKSTIPKGVDVAALAAGSESEVIKVLMAQMEQEKKLRSDAEAKVALLEGRLAATKGKSKAPAVSGSVTNEFCSHINKLTQMVDDLTTRNQVLELEVAQLRKQLHEKAADAPL